MRKTTLALSVICLLHKPWVPVVSGFCVRQIPAINRYRRLACMAKKWW